tara:strand:- start:802 stop:1152 length:351 start_codon:yes stop_codon:yes gene_type:complete
MSEKYNANDDLGTPSYFNHLMLEGEVGKLVNSEGFNPKDLTVELNINGVDVSIKDFNACLKDWGARIESEIKENLNYLSKEKSVNDNAKALLKEKLGRAYEILSDIENSEWVLDQN